MKFSIIVAVDENNGIGINNDLPWHLPDDLKRFAQITKGPEGSSNAVIMGRKTWESIPEKFRPLPGRLNMVLTRQDSYNVPTGVMTAPNIYRALHILEHKEVNEVFVIGGNSVYEEALKNDNCEKIYLTLVCHTFACDTFFPPLPHNIFELTDESEAFQTPEGITYKYLTYTRK
jgi:dihydrofolate reductase